MNHAEAETSNNQTISNMETERKEVRNGLGIADLILEKQMEHGKSSFMLVTVNHDFDHLDLAGQIVAQELMYLDGRVVFYNQEPEWFHEEDTCIRKALQTGGSTTTEEAMKRLLTVCDPAPSYDHELGRIQDVSVVVMLHPCQATDSGTMSWIEGLSRDYRVHVVAVVEDCDCEDTLIQDLTADSSSGDEALAAQRAHALQLIKEGKDEGFAEARRLADEGDPDGLFYTGLCLAGGFGCERSDREAYSYLRRSVLLKDSVGPLLSMYHLLIEDPESDCHNPMLGYHYLVRAAALGDEDAMLLLAEHYADEGLKAEAFDLCIRILSESSDRKTQYRAARLALDLGEPATGKGGDSISKVIGDAIDEIEAMQESAAS